MAHLDAAYGCNSVLRKPIIPASLSTRNSSAHILSITANSYAVRVGKLMRHETKAHLG
jgi:hypothetical protein